MSSQSKSKAISSFNDYDLEDVLPRWLQSAYTTSHIQSALTALDDREDARVRFRAHSIESARSANADRYLSVNANNSGGAGKATKLKAKAAAAAEAVSTHLSNSDPNQSSSEATDFYSIVSGILPENMQRNRYMDVLPYDRTRVKVKVPYFRSSGHVPAHTNSDEDLEGLYLNANWVQEKYGRKWWIASQAPLRTTAYTFLSLLLEDIRPPNHSTPSTVAKPSSSLSSSTSPPTTKPLYRSRPRTVVQLTQNVENGRRKAHPYFPDIIGQTMIVVPDLTDYASTSGSTSSSHLLSSKLKVTLIAQEEVKEACCIKSIVEVRPFVDPAVVGSDSDKNNDDIPLRPRPSSVSSVPRALSTMTITDSDSDHYGDSYDLSTSHRKTSEQSTQTAIRFTHLLFVGWPDHSIPSDRAALFEFVRLVDRVNRQLPSQTTDTLPTAAVLKDANDSSDVTGFKGQGSNSGEEIYVDPDPPIIVGCSAGIGRTGSFIAMNSLLRHAGFLPPPGELMESSSRSSHSSPLPSMPSAPTTPSELPATSLNSNTPLGPLPNTLSTDLVSQEIDSLRDQRAGMVQTPMQAVLVYEMMVGAYVERGELKR